MPIFYPGLFSPLLRLLATHFPQLCLVEDWMYEVSDNHQDSLGNLHGSTPSCSSQSISRGRLRVKIFRTEIESYFPYISSV